MFGIKHPTRAALTEALRPITQEADRRAALIADEIGDIHNSLRQLSAHVMEGFKLAASRDDGVQDQIQALHKRVKELEAFIAKSPSPQPTGRQRGSGAPEQKAAIPAGSGLKIQYKSSAGKVSQRVVIPQQAEIISLGGKPAVTEFTGYCTMRKAVRTFIISQISEAFDAETGEEVDPQDWILARCKA